jgi:hypothetical protein
MAAAGNPSIVEDKYLKTSEEFFDLARTATNPFMRAYYETVALRYTLTHRKVGRNSADRIGLAIIEAGDRAQNAIIVSVLCGLLLSNCNVRGFIIKL